MSGFDCEFVEKPPKAIQTDCPVCLLILCEPYQVTCCGKSFCKECIKKIKARSQPCPTCKQDEFYSFPNKGLQQPLYGFAVFCSNKEGGCVWEGELGQLDQHINSSPDKEKQLVGCAYTKIACLFCNKLHQRHEMKQHQTSVCPERPYVECEFSDAGCDAKVDRKDLASHLTDNLVSHMSLLAMENRKLKQTLENREQKAALEIRELQQQLKKQEEKAAVVNGKLEEKVVSLETQVKKLTDKVNKQTKELLLESKLADPTFRLPPVDVLCPAKFLHESRVWSSEPIRVYIAGSRMQLVFRVSFIGKAVDWIAVEKLEDLVQAEPAERVEDFFQAETAVQPKVKVAVILVDQQNGARNESFQLYIGRKDTNCYCNVSAERHVKNDQLIFSITNKKDVC